MTLQSIETRAAAAPLGTKTEYAVRFRQGMDDIVVPVGDETLMAQTVAEFLVNGDDAEPLTRTVPAWTVDETTLARVRHEVAREAILATAQRYWEQEIGEQAALEELRQHAPQMSDHDRAERLGELVSELEHQEDVDSSEVAPGPGQDRQTLVEDAERRVIEAADALYGGAS
ncbi:hypothetical protein E1287_07090 [Actinomadura sp. KC06]|uniref:hypothetical protein n=1 Tax=Actinomadura sp. KC06 TaxID=2530369 RepID=UPI001045184F|nr:hypothetical protein [Actinomadura sp. KC06]TDD37818.1 hypothetical protein E1287_07090 [Actinomadura sp. KC06]